MADDGPLKRAFWWLVGLVLIPLLCAVMFLGVPALIIYIGAQVGLIHTSFDAP